MRLLGAKALWIPQKHSFFPPHPLPNNSKMSEVATTSHILAPEKVPRVYISNLDYHTGEDELEEFLRVYNVYGPPPVLLGEPTDQTGAVF